MTKEDYIKELNILTQYAYYAPNLDTMDLTIIASINEHLADFFNNHIQCDTK